MGKIIDLTNMRFGSLIVVKKAERKVKSGSMWVCKCDCGNVIEVARCGLISGRSKSCGCSRIKFLSKNHIAEKHGKSRCNEGKCEHLYRVWLGIRQRCNNPNNNRYDLYGGRGIRICSSWDDYSNFRDWAYANGYDENAPRGRCTIDRIKVNGNYCPENCRWVDMKVQNQNKRKG